jgi:hypothetical protein
MRACRCSMRPSRQSEADEIGTRLSWTSAMAPGTKPDAMPTRSCVLPSGASRSSALGTGSPRRSKGSKTPAGVNTRRTCSLGVGGLRCCRYSR